MERLCVYVIYDPEAVIHRYVYEIMATLMEHVDYIVAVCNFSKPQVHDELIESLADEIVYRENKGYDAGAFKDELLTLYQNGVIDKYDELILCNDSFYGLFYSMNHIFDEMGRNNCDYWGLTRCLGGTTFEGIEYGSHIESFFFCFGKQVISSDEFYAFWKELKYPESFLEAVLDYEISINNMLSDAGFVGMSYMDNKEISECLSIGEIPYMKYPYRLIAETKIPVLKRRALDFDNPYFSDAVRAIKYVKDNTGYNVDIIIEHLMRRSDITGKIPQYSLTELDSFYYRHEEIYIYGNGVWGKNLKTYFDAKGWCFTNYIVSDNTNEKNSICFDEHKVSDNSGVIIATGKKEYIEQIYKKCLTKYRELHIFKPEYIE